MNKKIFIGGTGRSGTTIISSLLGSHKEIFKIPTESRFIIDKGGMIDVFHSLTDRYSIDQSRMALKEFNDLMTIKLTSRLTAPYIGFDFHELFDKDTYNKHFNGLFNQLKCGEFVGSDFHSEENLKFMQVLLGNNFGMFIKNYRRVLNKIKKENNWPKEKMYIGKYFNDDNDLLYLMSKYINDLFFGLASKNKKYNWCEDTPANILNLNFLSRLFPDAYFIHVIRNPIGVAASMKNRFWAPNNFSDIVIYLSNIYEKLIDIQKIAQKDNINFIELKLEYMIDDFEKSKREIVNFLDVSNEFDNVIELKKSRNDFYKNKLSKNEYNFLEDKLSKYIEHYYGN